MYTSLYLWCSAFPWKQDTFDCWVSLVGFWPRLFTQGYGCTLSLQIESLCSAMLVCWGFCWDRPADLKSYDGPLAGPAPPALSKQPDLSLAPHASCLSSPAAGEWFQHSDPHCSGTGLWLLRKAGFFSDPASCQHGACPSPARGVSSHSGWVSMSLLMRCWTRELRQAGAEQALFNQRLKSPSPATTTDLQRKPSGQAEIQKPEDVLFCWAFRLCAGC